MYFLADRPEISFIDPVIIAGMLLAIAAIAFGRWSRHRLRRRPPRGPGYQVFREDLSGALMSWGIAELSFTGGWALRTEGLRAPIWSYLGLLVGIAIGVLAWRRERGGWPALAKTDGVELLPDGKVQRGEGQTWEMGMLAAGGLGLATYLGRADHAFGHPIHWLITAAAVSAGYGLGLAIWSPRFKLTSVRASRAAIAGSKRAARKSKQPRSQRDREA